MNLRQRAEKYQRVVDGLFFHRGITGKTQRFSRGARHLTMPIVLDNPLNLEKALKLSENIALRSSVSYVQAYRQEGYVIYQFDLNPGFWESYTRQDVKGLAVGLADSRRPVKFGFDLPHCLVAGTTGSGKSVTIASILFGLMISYSPQESGMVIIDPDKELTGFTNAAHLEMPIAHEADEIHNALLWSDQQLKYRRQEDIKNGKTLIIAADEAQQDKVLGDARNKAIVQNIAQGRKYNVHLVIGTQKPSHTDMPKILDNLGNRFIGLVADAGIGSRLTGQPGLNCNKLTGKGDFVHVQGGTTERLQVAMVTSRDYESLDRKEVKPVKVDSIDVIDLPAELPDPVGGRPVEVQLNPQYLAWYFHHHPDKISRGMARETLGLKQRGHELHQQFCREFIKAYLELRKSGA